MGFLSARSATPRLERFRRERLHFINMILADKFSWIDAGGVKILTISFEISQANFGGGRLILEGGAEVLLLANCAGRRDLI